MLYTTGFNYYIDYRFHLTITEGLKELGSDEAEKYYKIIYIKNGPCHFVMNGKEFVLTGACAVCMNEKDQIDFCNVEEDGVKILWFQPTLINLKFTYEAINGRKRNLTTTECQDFYYLQQFAKENNETYKIMSLHTIDSTEIERKMQIMKEILTKQDSNTWPCRCRSYLFEILFCLKRQEEEEGTSRDVLQYEGCSRLAVEVIYYLQSCYQQKITVESLADLFHTNRTTLLNDFKKYTGQSVNQYLIELRMTMAASLLRDTGLSVEEICDRTGFRDISYFSKVFKKRLLYTPSEYRRLHKHEF
jgi:AraC-type DNA-binding domain-containing proteins